MRPVPARDAVLTAYAQSLIRVKARQLSRKRGFSRSDEDDVAQELTAYLLARAHRFDPDRASVSTFADRVIRSAIATLLRDRRRQKRAVGFTVQSLEGTSVAQDRGSASLRDTLGLPDRGRRTGTANDEESRAETVTAVVEALRSLRPDLQDVCRRLSDGTIASVARDLGLSRHRVGIIVGEIRRHFEAAGLGNS